MDNIQILNDRFKARYSKVFQELNVNLVELPLEDVGDGTKFYLKPTVKIVGNGIAIYSLNQGIVDLGKPAKVTLDTEVVEPACSLIRAVIPATELELLATNQAYFNLLFDKTVDFLIKSYNKEIGGHDILRYGKQYLDFDKITIDDSGDIMLQLIGNLASNNIITKG